MTTDRDYERVRREADPIARGRLATDLLAVYQRRTTELARTRREAMRQLQRQGMSYAAIADAFGLSKGRIGQITQVGPAVERGFFGEGPVSVAVPLRRGAGRSLPMIAGEDALAYENIREALVDLGFEVEQVRIPPNGEWSPQGDVIAICGPKSSPVTATAIRTDPYLDFRQDPDGHWIISDRDSGATYHSPMDSGPSTLSADIAYVGRLPIPSGTILVIAGVHALGSLGAVHYLTEHLPELYEQVGNRRFSMVTSSTHSNESVLTSEAVCPPRIHE